MKNVPLYKKVRDSRPDAVMHITNCFGIALFDVNGNSCIAAFSNGEGYDKAHNHEIHYSTSGRPYIRKGGCRWYLDQFSRISA